MESVQRELVSVLLEHIHSLGLISNSTCSRAVDLVYSMADLPELFRYSLWPAKEVNKCECAQDTQ